MTHIRTISLAKPYIVLGGLLLAACQTRKEAPADSTKSVSVAGAVDSGSHRLRVITQLKTPESVKYDPDLDVFFVSNINGVPSAHDGNGYIVRIPAESTTVTTFIEGGKNGVKLDAPKGMAINGDQLYVADIDVVRVFDKRTGRPLKTVDLKPLKATFLNDIAVGPDSAIYVTDTGIHFDDKGTMTHPGVNRIFKITLKDDKVTEAATGDPLANPNGITWDAANSRFLLAPFGAKDVQTWTPGQAPAKLIDGPGGYDGIEVLSDGRILVSSWADSSVQAIRNGAMTKLVANVSAPADIGVDTRRHVLAIPRFERNEVELWTIP